jgi:hypothetical protein
VSVNRDAVPTELLWLEGAALGRERVMWVTDSAEKFSQILRLSSTSNRDRDHVVHCRESVLKLNVRREYIAGLYTGPLWSTRFDTKLEESNGLVKTILIAQNQVKDGFLAAG